MHSGRAALGLRRERNVGANSGNEMKPGATRPASAKLTAILAVSMLLLAAHPAAALSEIPEEDLPVPEGEADPGDAIEREQLPPPQAQPGGTGAPRQEEPPAPPATGMPVPLPDPITIPQDPPSDEVTVPGEAGDEPVPEVVYDAELLPEPVKRLRALIMEACLSGDIEQLRPLLGTGDDTPQLSFGDSEGDPVEFLRSISGDGEGQEILAILYEVLAAGYVHLDPGEPTELYIWPYFFAVPLETLDPRQRVELFKLVTAGDYEDMKNFGAYIFYRVGISPEGKWVFFVAGD